jgi:Sigma-70, region 4
MAGTAGGRTLVAVTAQAGPSELQESIPHVYGAALAASRDHHTAVMVAEEVLVAAANDLGGRPAARSELTERAIRLGVRTAPGPGFADMESDDREVVALARLGGYSVSDIAARLGRPADQVKAAMLRGLQSAAGTGPFSRGSGPQTPPPLPGCGSAASPAHGARGS